MVKKCLPIYPLCVASCRLTELDAVLVTIATSDYFLRFFIIRQSDEEITENCSFKVTEDWVTNLDFSKSKFSESNDLAVSNNDKKLRVYRIFKETEQARVEKYIPDLVSEETRRF